MIELPKTRQEARDVGSKAYFTGLFCKNGHVSKRWTATGNCAACQQQNTKNWTNNNPDKVRAFFDDPVQREKSRASNRKHYQANKLWYLEKYNKRRASKLQATTTWGQEGISAFYKKAKELESLNKGTKYHVDHIIPLAGDNVCGLHNQFNLQILTEQENKRKGKAWN